jgi:hypothetical protein
MERTVPSTASEEVELYLRTYYSLLRSSAEVRIQTLEEVHTGMNSLLHLNARDQSPDMSAFIYSLLRLPSCMPYVQMVVLGQSPDVFMRVGFGDVFSWEEVSSVARRRRCYFNGTDILACFIASRSDIDDVIPLLTAYQIEWNKMHDRLQRLSNTRVLSDMCNDASGYSQLAEILEIPLEDFDRLYAIWDQDFGCNIERIATSRRDFRVLLLSGSLSDYRRATHLWWDNIVKVAPELEERPIYFVSSNTHSMVNICSGFAKKSKDKLLKFLQLPGNTGLFNEWNDIQAGKVQSNRDNFLYYVIRKYQQTEEGREFTKEKLNHESSMGITRIPSERYFDVEAQVIDISQGNPDLIDPRLFSEEQFTQLKDSNALILNIDYPLGLAAYNILSEVSSHAGDILGVYVMGKAATLNAVLGDVMISNVIHDEHSQSTYLFSNCFNASDIAPDLVYGTVLDNQKAVTVKGTFLQNAQYMDVFYREGYTDIEMEAGPYLSAVYEMFRPQRHPVNEIVNLYGLPFDLGIVHYASDTPLGKGKNLGAGRLSYYGMDSTYAVSLAILRRIFKTENDRLQKGENL